jgi:hypothetical protein
MGPTFVADLFEDSDPAGAFAERVDDMVRAWDRVLKVAVYDVLCCNFLESITLHTVNVKSV